MDDDISTYEILKAGAEVLPFRTNNPEISKFLFSLVSVLFYDKAKEARENYEGHVVVTGVNYAQGSGWEHAAIAPRFLGSRPLLQKAMREQAGKISSILGLHP